MPSDNMPTKELDLGVWVTNFAEVAVANATALGLTTTQTGQLTTFAGLYNTRLTDANTAKVAAKSAVVAKNSIRDVTINLFSGYAKSILASPDVVPELKSELGMNPEVTPKTPLSAPVDLSALAYSTGKNTLKWKRGVNSRTVIFVIEAKFGLSPNWVILGQTQRVTYNDFGRTPGEMITYRVYAERGGAQSDYSNQAVVYSVSEPETVFLKQAA